ncbi:hypothetical protein FI667_g17518, partial [Globisporangium splendens]
MEQQYCLMLEHLLIIAPEVSSGYSQNESPIITLLSADLPESLDQQRVLLVGSFMCEEENRALNDVIEQVVARGELEKHIALLTIFTSGKVVDRISRKYQDLLILAVDIGGSPNDVTKYERFTRDCSRSTRSSAIFVARTALVFASYPLEKIL